MSRHLGSFCLALISVTTLGAMPASAQDKVCATTGTEAPLERHKAWVLQGWERHVGDAPFDFAKKMNRFYDLVDTRGVFYDNLSPNGAPIFDSSIKYGRNWEASVNGSRTILHALTGHNGQLVGDGIASTTLGFVGDITRLSGARIFFDARSQLGWTCTGGEWVIRHELNYAWNVPQKAVAPYLARSGK